MTPSPDVCADAPAAANVRGPLLIAAALTLALTVVRVAGERLRWAPCLFGREAGGGGALLGIGWFIPVCGVWFARRLVAAGLAPDRRRALGWAALGLLGVAAVFAVGKLLLPVTACTFAFVALALPLCALLAFRAWPDLARVLLAYAAMARLPVLVVTVFAVAGNWGTHYEQLAPGSPEMGHVARTLILCVAQICLWVPLTVLGGTFAGAWLLRPQQRHCR